MFLGEIISSRMHLIPSNFRIKHAWARVIDIPESSGVQLFVYQKKTVVRV